MNLLAKKISETRKAKGLTQEELADKAKLSLRTIQRIESSKNEPRGTTLNLICEVLEINLKEVIMSKYSFKKIHGAYIVNGFFLLTLNLVLMGIIGFLTLDSNANINSVVGGFLVSIFLPFFIVFWTKKISGIERMLKYGFGYLVYFILVMLNNGFSVGFLSGLFPCLLISVSVLYFGNDIIKNSNRDR